MMLEIAPIPAFRDNYIWLLRRGRHAVVVDPGDAAPVLAALRQHDLTLDAILITHHHDDHIGGVEALLQAWPATVHAPAREHYPFPHQPVAEGDLVDCAQLGIRFQVLETPGHTLGHVAYYGADRLFCGDTLFSCGCGRLFEGTCQQLYDSLQRLAKLPPDTAVYCAHEYTEHNIRFARSLDPDNAALAQWQARAKALQAAGTPTLPTTIGLELATNPFLRCGTPAIIAAATRYSPQQEPEPRAIFCTLRAIRNSF